MELYDQPIFSSQRKFPFPWSLLSRTVQLCYALCPSEANSSASSLQPPKVKLSCGKKIGLYFFPPRIHVPREREYIFPHRISRPYLLYYGRRFETALAFQISSANLLKVTCTQSRIPLHLGGLTKEYRIIFPQKSQSVIPSSYVTSRKQNQ